MEYAQNDERFAKPLPGLLYRSRPMHELACRIYKLQGDHLSVLITGESGTGKELIARAIHTLSARRQHPFVPLNCASTTKDLMDAHLFGHKRGAFTGATQDAPGAIRAAADGTLFLDEIGELPRKSQPKLLRFLETGEIQPLGVPVPQQVKVRVIAATNADVEALLERGKFRADLYYRLNIIRLHLPPLRERSEEIALLARHFLVAEGKAIGKEHLRFAPETLDVLTAADWPGNVRQLKNEVQRLLAYWPDGTIIRPDHLSPEVRCRPQPSNGHTIKETASATLPSTLNDHLMTVERNLIEQCLIRHQRNVSLAAEELGVSARALYNKLHRLQIPLLHETTNSVKNRSRLR